MPPAHRAPRSVRSRPVASPTCTTSAAAPYWSEMLEFCRRRRETRCRRLVPAGTDLGPVLAEVVERLPPAARVYRVNAGALDHFCAMVGTGSYTAGIVSESAGTVLVAVAARRRLVLRPRAEGVVPRRACARARSCSSTASTAAASPWSGSGARASAGMGYDDLEARARAHAPMRPPRADLPAVPDRREPARLLPRRPRRVPRPRPGARPDRPGVRRRGGRRAPAAPQRRLPDCRRPRREIVSTGGGAASAFWNQLKADVCGIDVVVPDEREATCRGAAAWPSSPPGEIARPRRRRPAQPPPDAFGYRHRARPSAHARYARFEDYLAPPVLTTDDEGEAR